MPITPLPRFRRFVNADLSLFLLFEVLNLLLLLVLLKSSNSVRAITSSVPSCVTKFYSFIVSKSLRSPHGLSQGSPRNSWAATELINVVSDTYSMTIYHFRNYAHFFCELWCLERCNQKSCSPLFFSFLRSRSWSSPKNLQHDINWHTSYSSSTQQSC